MANYTEKELANVPAEELIEIIMDLQNDKDEIDDFTEVDLGLDTLQYKFEKGNLQIVQKFEQFLQNELNTIHHAEIFK